MHILLCVFVFVSPVTPFEYLPVHMLHVVYGLLTSPCSESNWSRSSDACVTWKARMQTFTKALQNEGKANRCRGWGELRGTGKALNVH